MDRSSIHVAVTVPIFSLRRDRDDPGIGKYPDLGRHYVEELALQGADTVLLLPHFAVGDESPYAPVSVYAANEDNIDWTAVPEAGPGSANLVRAEARQAWTVDYEGVRRREAGVAEAAYREFRRKELARATRRAVEFRRFVRAQASWLNDYVEFIALARLIGKAFPDWTEAEANETRRTARFREAAEFQAYVQWVAYSQLRRALAHVHVARGRILFDMPMFRSKHGVDAWRTPDLFADLSTRNPGIKNRYCNEDWHDLALWRWSRLRANAYRFILAPFTHWLNFGFDGARVDALHFAYDFGGGQHASGDEPGDEYVRILGELFRSRGALPLAEALEGKAANAEAAGFVTIGGRWRKLSSHDDQRSCLFPRLWTALRQGSAGQPTGRFIAYTLGDELGDPVPIKEFRDGRSYWRYRIPLPGDTEYAARVRCDIRPHLRSLKYLRNRTSVQGADP